MVMVFLMLKISIEEKSAVPDTIPGILRGATSS